jgi:hypothetical protein
MQILQTFNVISLKQSRQLLYLYFNINYLSFVQILQAKFPVDEKKVS